MLYVVHDNPNETTIFLRKMYKYWKHQSMSISLIKILRICTFEIVLTERKKPLQPLSMWTSKIFFWRLILRPTQVLQRSLWLMRWPWPWQEPHIVDTCCTMPNPSWWSRICTPVPRHEGYTSSAPFLPPRPGKDTTTGACFKEAFCDFQWKKMPLMRGNR